MATFELDGKSWVEIPIEHALKFAQLPCDVYIMLSPYKIVKLVGDGDIDQYSSETIERYILKGVRTLCVESGEFEKLSKHMREEFEVARSDKKVSDLNNKINAEVNAVSIANITLRELGTDEDTEQLLCEVCDNSVSTLLTDPNLSDIVGNFSSSDSFLYGHSILSAYIAGLIGVEMGWKTSSTLQKLAFASILHDVSLESDLQALCSDLEGVHPDLTRKDTTLIKEHPLKSKMIAEKVRGLMPDVADIILCHHELPDGSGYPRGLVSSQISQIAATFILAECFAKHVYGKHLTPGILNMIADTLKTKYAKGNFRAPMVGLLKVIDRAAQSLV